MAQRRPSRCPHRRRRRQEVLPVPPIPRFGRPGRYACATAEPVDGSATLAAEAGRADANAEAASRRRSRAVEPAAVRSARSRISVRAISEPAPRVAEPGSRGAAPFRRRGQSFSSRVPQPGHLVAPRRRIAAPAPHRPAMPIRPAAAIASAHPIPVRCWAWRAVRCRRRRGRRRSTPPIMPTEPVS